MKRLTEEEVLNDAIKFKIRRDWYLDGKAKIAAGGFSAYNSARRRGPEFFTRCCAHMPNLRQPLTVDDLIASAAPFKHRSDWKKAFPVKYNIAWQRKILDQCCAHMTPLASPYSGSYIIYAYEFEDKHAYIGLTFTPTIRRTTHGQRGPVFEHAKVCPGFTYRILEENIASPQDAVLRECHWIEQYKPTWTLLNASPGGGLGTVQITKWTREAVINEARNYASKQEWIDKSQFTYRLAKREGWFDEASAHMPPRILGVGKGKKFTKEHREKLAEVKRGVPQSETHKTARSAGIKNWWATR